MYILSLLLSHRVVHCNLGLRLIPPLLYVLVWSKMLYLVIILNNGSCVLGCFLDVSKAFDLVNHDILFHNLSVRALPLPVIHFLSSWYCYQQMKVRWDHSLSELFHVSNGVRQGGVLSPVLFAVYLVYLKNWLIVVVVVIGVTCFLERFAMQMILFCWHHVHLLSE